MDRIEVPEKMAIDLFQVDKIRPLIETLESLIAAINTNCSVRGQRMEQMLVGILDWFFEVPFA